MNPRERGKYIEATAGKLASIAADPDSYYKDWWSRRALLELENCIIAGKSLGWHRENNPPTAREYSDALRFILSHRDEFIRGELSVDDIRPFAERMDKATPRTRLERILSR